jgi:hypothetical protein
MAYKNAMSGRERVIESGAPPKVILFDREQVAGVLCESRNQEEQQRGGPSKHANPILPRREAAGAAIPD